VGGFATVCVSLARAAEGVPTDRQTRSATTHPPAYPCVQSLNVAHLEAAFEDDVTVSQAAGAGWVDGRVTAASFAGPGAPPFLWWCAACGGVLLQEKFAGRDTDTNPPTSPLTPPLPPPPKQSTPGRPGAGAVCGRHHVAAHQAGRLLRGHSGAADQGGAERGGAVPRKRGNCQGCQGAHCWCIGFGFGLGLGV